MDLQIPTDLEARLNRLAAETGRDAHEIALDFLRNSIEYDHWFRSQVEQGRASAQRGDLLDHADVASRIGRRFV